MTEADATRAAMHGRAGGRRGPRSASPARGEQAGAGMPASAFPTPRTGRRPQRPGLAPPCKGGHARSPVQGRAGDAEPSTATDCAPRWRWPDSLTAEATEGPGTGPPARPATCRPRGDRARPAPGGSLSNRRAGNDSSTSTRLPRLEPRHSFLAGEADSVPPLTGPRPPRPPENRKQEGRQPKKHRCAPHGSNAGVRLCTRSLPNCFLDTSAGGKYL